MQERRWVRLGGWAALAAGGLSLAVAAAAIATLARPGALVGLALLGDGLGVIEAFVVALAVAGVLAAFAPAPRVLLAGSAAGWLAAAGMAAGSLPAPLVGLRYFASVPLGVWMLCVAATGWRLRRLPAWLRVTGAVLGALLMILPALPELHALALLLGLAWWFGLGAALLNLTKSPLIPAEAGTQA